MKLFQKYALKVGFNKYNVNIKYIQRAKENRKQWGTGNLTRILYLDLEMKNNL